MINKVIILVLICLIGSLGFSQTDTLLSLGTNAKLMSEHNKSLLGIANPKLKKQTRNKAIISLPFLDDFSQNYHLPDQSKWIDFNVYINSSFPIDPITYGVATFDGLDHTGFPYDFSNPTSYGEADILTSDTIDLANITDSVYLSFYYQPQGNGNQPELQDSLTLEFLRSSDSTWIRIWGVSGSSSQPFDLVMIPVDTSFHKSIFQFRFKNYATLSGNVDHWNLDYVYLNDNRTFADTLLNDVSFITDHHNFLNEYTAMPWDHYKTDSIGLMTEFLPVSYKNNSDQVYPIFFKYEITEFATTPILEVYPPTQDFQNVDPFSTITIPQAVHSINPFINDFSFPTDNSENKVFQIRNYFNLGTTITDSLQKNDTVTSFQVFGSYYAYDDGSAELGYGVQGIDSKLAHEFNILKSDTLTALQVYFSPIRDDNRTESFKLTVWSSLNPETIIYQQTDFYLPDYSLTNEFLLYPLNDPIILSPGTYFFGWQKISPNFLNVGWDVNTNNSSKVHYNVSDIWETSNFDGSLMLRPVFGTTGDPAVGINEVTSNEENDFYVYPNPSSDIIYFNKIGNTVNSSNYVVQLVDIYGKIAINTFVSDNSLNVSNISNGIYFIRFIDQRSNNVTTKKVIISK